MNTTYSDWSVPTLSVSIWPDGSLIHLQSTFDYCWKIEDNGIMTQIPQSTAGYNSVTVTYSLFGSGLVGNKECLIEYTTNNGQSYQELYRLGDNIAVTDQLFNGWGTAADDNSIGVGLRLSSIGNAGQHCYFNEFSIKGTPTNGSETTYNPPTYNPTTYYNPATSTSTTDYPTTTVGSANTWISFPGTSIEYMYVTQCRGWDESIKYCQDIGGELASGSTSAKRDFLVNTVYDGTNPTGSCTSWLGSYVGGTTNTIDTVTWFDGTTTKFYQAGNLIDWDLPEDEPDNLSKHIVMGFKLSSREWHTVYPGDSNVQFCQRTVSSISLPTASTITDNPTPAPTTKTPTTGNPTTSDSTTGTPTTLHPTTGTQMTGKPTVKSITGKLSVTTIKDNNMDNKVMETTDGRISNMDADILNDNKDNIDDKTMIYIITATVVGIICIVTICLVCIVTICYFKKKNKNDSNSLSTDSRMSLNDVCSVTSVTTPNNGYNRDNETITLDLNTNITNITPMGSDTDHHTNNNEQDIESDNEDDGDIMYQKGNNKTVEGPPPKLYIVHSIADSDYIDGNIDDDIDDEHDEELYTIHTTDRGEDGGDTHGNNDNNVDIKK